MDYIKIFRATVENWIIWAQSGGFAIYELPILYGKPIDSSRIKRLSVQYTES